VKRPSPAHTGGHADHRGRQPQKRPGALLDELGLDDVRDTPYGINDRAAAVAMAYETGLLVPRGG
jgi:hypothetical protein